MKILRIRVIPQSSKNAVMDTMDNGMLKVKLTTSPIDGAANKALINLLSKYYNVPKNLINIIKGHKKRDKVVEIKV